MRFFIAPLFIFWLPAVSFAQAPGKAYNNGHGGSLTLPQGDISFADKVVSYRPGNPAPIKENANPQDAVGIPDFNLRMVTGFVSLGTGGELVLAFTDNALVNIDGPDLYVLRWESMLKKPFFLFPRTGAIGSIPGK
jgi:hypothetical protein